MNYSRPAAVAGAVAVLALVILAGQSGFARLAGPAAPQEAGVRPSDGSPASAPPAQPTATARPQVEVQLAEPTVKQYGRLKLSASGLAPGETVVVTGQPEGDAAPIELGETQADEQGNVGEFGADLPEAITSGARPITVAGRDSRRQGSATLYVRAEKLFAVLSSYTPRPGEKLGFVTGGFEPGEEVQVYLGETATGPLATLKADQAGNSQWTEVETPVVTPGEYALTFEGQNGENQYVQTIEVSALTPSLELSPWSGPPGSNFNLNGRGFLPGESVQVFVDGGTQPATTFQADEYGNYWGIGPLTVPVAARGGQAEIRLVGQQTGAEVTQTFTVVGVKPWLELSAYSGMPGTAVRFSGGGFAARERVTIHLGNGRGPVVATAQTDEQGNVVRSSATTIPGDVASPNSQETTVTYTMVGESSGGEASGVFTVVYPYIPQLNPERPAPAP